jgi:hypothetical protein
MRRLPRCRDRDYPGRQEAVADYRSRASRLKGLAASACARRRPIASVRYIGSR